MKEVVLREQQATHQVHQLFQREDLEVLEMEEMEILTMEEIQVEEPKVTEETVTMVDLEVETLATTVDPVILVTTV